MTEPRNPFVLGKPIKAPTDFYGRDNELRELFESMIHMQPVALVGEHRCGNTSILYQMLNPEVRARYLDPGEEEGLLFAFINSQLAADGTDAFYRRIARAVRRYDPTAEMDFDAPIDAFWIEDYLEDVTERDRRLVVLLDEFEVLSEFETGFWEWFRGLITEYDLSIVVATRVELGDFRAEWGQGSPFFNMFRTIYVGSFTESETESFLSETTEAAGIDLAPVRDAMLDLGGRFPYYLQVAGSQFFKQSQVEDLTGAPEQLEAVAANFSSRAEALFEDVYAKLPDRERDALAWLAVEAQPEARDALPFEQALPGLERRGYVVGGRVFSSAFADFVRRQIRRIDLSSETGEVRIDKRPVDLPPKEFALLRFLIEKEGEIVSKDEIAAAVWPEYNLDTVGVTDAMIQKTISRLRKEIDIVGTGFQHIESVRGQGYRFQNASVYEVHDHRERAGQAG